ncbi:hypothetical protein B296_00028916 [Ensete ventricosum]|uniref:Uncharacterized protein n=1 Tax=Ensete ventricosum TaxID=4639 RepID=A0A426Y7Y9_ENSVE|nr:hypothetical protein B296_00028916 [Ensete ventricosum]
MKSQPDDGPRSSLSIELGLVDLVGSHQEFAKRFTEGMGKLAGSTPGDQSEEDRMTYRKHVGGYRIGRS